MHDKQVSRHRTLGFDGQRQGKTHRRYCLANVYRVIPIKWNLGILARLQLMLGAFRCPNGWLAHRVLIGLVWSKKLMTRPNVLSLRLKSLLPHEVHRHQ